MSNSSASSFESVMVVPRWIPMWCNLHFSMLAALLLLSSRMQPLELHSATSCWLFQRCALVLCSPGEARLLQPPVALFALTQLQSGVGSTNVHRPRSDEFITLPASFLCHCGGDEWDWPWFICWSVLHNLKVEYLEPNATLSNAEVLTMQLGTFESVWSFLMNLLDPFGLWPRWLLRSAIQMLLAFFVDMF